MPGSPVHNPEFSLVDAAAAGDREARRALFEQHRDAAYQVAFRVTGRMEDALDVVQDSFISAFGHLERFQRESGFRTWLLRIVTNRALDLLRARRVRAAVSLEGDEENAPNPAVGDRGAGQQAVTAGLEAEELGARLRQALAALPPEQRAVFALYARGELTYGQIAEIVGIPIGTVMSRLYHARRKLRELLPDLAPQGTAGEQSVRAGTSDQNEKPTRHVDRV